jgi:uncharacterized protein YecT (DUF1311 family)
MGQKRNGAPTMRAWFAIAVLVLPASAALAALDCTDKPECWPEGSAMNVGLKARQRLETADRELNATYQRILKSLPADADDNNPKGTLVSGQREWVKFRDADCAAVGEVSGGVRMWKSAYEVACEADMTQARNAELKKRYEEPDK